MASASPICLVAHATSTMSWLWHQRLSHLNFYTINDLTKNDLVIGLPKFKYQKEHLCPTCEQGKSKKASHKPKHVLNSKQRLHLLHMDLCGPMRVESINGKRSKNEAPEEIKTFLKKITSLLQAQVIIVRIDNGIEFKNQVLKEYFDSIGISHQASSIRTPQQNRVVERRNRTQLLLRATLKTAPSFIEDSTKHHTSLLTAKNRISLSYMYSRLSVIPRMIVKILGSLEQKVILAFSLDILLIVVLSKYTTEGKRKSWEMMNVTFDELSAIAFEQHTMYDDYMGGQQSKAQRTTLANQNLLTPDASTTVEESAPTPTNSLQSPNIPNTSQDVGELPQQQHVQQKDNQALLQPETDVNNV
ncbi:putative ribonuclease H-like domain-containing protein [Tanacetum coccineum]